MFVENMEATVFRDVFREAGLRIRNRLSHATGDWLHLLGMAVAMHVLPDAAVLASCLDAQN